MTRKTEELFYNAAEIERMHDVLSMGLPDAKTISISLVSSGVTLASLFGNS
jgi:hypothetical protein